MKRTILSSICVLAAVMTSTAVSAIDFDPFVIRNANSGGDVPTITENAAKDGALCATPLGGQKVGYGTHYFDGQAFSAIQSVDFDRVSGPTNIVPYVNVWVTNGSGKYAVISTENDYRGENWATYNQFKVFETNYADLDWILGGASANRSGSQYLQKSDGNGGWVNVTGADILASIGDPGTYPAPIGSGAPKNGTGFNIIWGDTASNYAGVYHYENLTINGMAVPEPASIAMLSLGGLALIRRRRSA